MKIAPRAPAEPDSISSTSTNGAPKGRRDAADAQLALEGLSHSFAELRVLDRVELRAAPNEVVGLVGPSGCGKTTLLELVAGLREPSSGTVRVGDATTADERLRQCAYMPQRDLLLPWLSAIDNASLALRVRGASRPAARETAAPLFERFGLAGFERARPAQLSGGMRQRVAFLRTLLAGKPLLLLDEPFAGLDAITRGEMQEWLAAALAAAPRTILMVTHDVEEALYLCDRVAVLSRRPAKIVVELASSSPRADPRLEAITAPEFAALRERALEALR
jgi:ABC-type nitrate/sulfonate/bicarbonate transport system ATPase subunit